MDTDVLDESGNDEGVEGQSAYNDGFFYHDMSKLIKYKQSNLFLLELAFKMAFQTYDSKYTII